MPKSDNCWLCYIVAFLGASLCASLGTVETWHQRGPIAQWPCPRMRLAFLWRWVCHCYCHSHACLGAMFDECWFFHLLCKPAALQPRLHCLDYCAQAHQSPSRVGSSTRVKGAVLIAYQKKHIWIQVEKSHQSFKISDGNWGSYDDWLLFWTRSSTSDVSPETPDQSRTFRKIQK